GAPDAIVRLPDVTNVAVELAVTPDVPATVPIVSADPSVTERLAALAASVPMLFPEAFSEKLPLAPDSSRVPAAMLPPDWVMVPFSVRTKSPFADEIVVRRSVSPDAVSASVPVPLLVIEVEVISPMAVPEAELPERARLPLVTETELLELTAR